MNDDNRPTPDEVEEHINQLNSPEWSVEDYHASYGPSTDYSVTIELTWSEPDLSAFDSGKQRHLAKTVKDIIRDMQGDKGAPTDEVTRCAVQEHDLESDVVRTTISRLKETGEIYQPNEDRFRVI